MAGARQEDREDPRGPRLGCRRRARTARIETGYRWAKPGKPKAGSRKEEADKALPLLPIISAVLITLVAVCLSLAFVAVALISSALSGVYAAAVCRYAAEGESDGFFTSAMVRSAFRRK